MSARHEAGVARREGTALVAVAWMVGALLSFLTMAVGIRELSANLDPFEIVFLRSGLGVVIMVGVALAIGRHTLASRQPGLQAFRHIIQFGGQVAWVYSVGVLPLTLVFAIEFTTPIWSTLLATLFLKERMTWGRFGTVAVGFLGVLIIVRPGLAEVHPAAFLLLAGMFCFACMNTATKKLVATDHAVGIMFWMVATHMLLSSPMALAGGLVVETGDIPWIVLVACLGLSAHYCLSKALGAADAVFVLPFDFMRLPLIATIGLVLYGEPLDPWIFAGAAIIFAGLYLNLRHEHRQGRAPA